MQKLAVTVLVVLTILAAVSFSATGAEKNGPPAPVGVDRKKKKGQDTARAVRQLGRIQSRAIRECSGVVASRRFPGVLWTHNDHGNDPALYAITREGRLLAQYWVPAPIDDWEDIAMDAEGHLFVGDLGNNEGWKSELKVFRVTEPDPNNRTAPGWTRLKIEVTWRLRFPAKPFDCESLFVYGDNGYVIDKVAEGKHARLYRFRLTPGGGTQQLEEVARLPIKHPATGADISADGKRLAMVSKAGLFLFDVDGDPRRAGEVTPVLVKLPKLQFEGVCFVPDGILLTAESGEMAFYQVN